VKSETRVSTTEYERDLLPNCKIAQTKSLQPRSNVRFTGRKFHYCVSFVLNIVIIIIEMLQITLTHVKYYKILMFYWSLKTFSLTQFT